MGKFVKESIMDKIKKKSLDEKFKIFTMAKGMSKESIDKIYSIYFWAMDGFIRGKPTWWQVEGWKLYVISGIDTDYNKEAKDRAKLILKNYKKDNFVSFEDCKWIENELKPYFVESLKKQTNKTIQMLDAVDEGKMKEFMSKVKKEKEGRFK